MNILGNGKTGLEKQIFSPRARDNVMGQCEMRGRNKGNPPNEWWLEPIGSAELSQEAVESAESGDAKGFLDYVPEDFRLEVVFRNAQRLRRFKVYEKALVAAFLEPRLNNRNSYGILGKLFRRADRKRLLEAGDTLRGKGAVHSVSRCGWKRTVAARARMVMDQEHGDSQAFCRTF